MKEALIPEAEIEKPQTGEILIEGVVFKYKTTPRKLPHKWLDLEIINRKGETIQMFFNPRRQHFQKEIRRMAKFHKWV